MRLINKKILEKLKRKNKGNASLIKSIDKLVKDISDNNWKDQAELNETRQDKMPIMFIAMDSTFSISASIEL